MEIQIQYLPAADLQPWSRNPKKHDHAKIIASIMRFGFTAPVLLDEATGRIIAGHGRVESLLQIKNSPKFMKELAAAGLSVPKRVSVGDDGEWLVPAVRGLEFASESEAEAYLIADNRLTELGGWDDDMLLDMLKDIQTNVADAPFLGTGYTDREIENLMRKADVERDAGPTVQEKADSFINAGVKQIVVFFKADVYDSVIERMEAAQKAHGIDNHTDLLMKLLEQDERRRVALAHVVESASTADGASEDDDEQADAEA